MFVVKFYQGEAQANDERYQHDAKLQAFVATRLDAFCHVVCDQMNPKSDLQSKTVTLAQRARVVKLTVLKFAEPVNGHLFACKEEFIDVPKLGFEKWVDNLAPTADGQGRQSKSSTNKTPANMYSSYLVCMSDHQCVGWLSPSHIGVTRTQKHSACVWISRELRTVVPVSLTHTRPCTALHHTTQHHTQQDCFGQTRRVRGKQN